MDMKNRKEYAFNSHLAEFSALRDEINLSFQSQTNFVNYAIAIIGGTASLFAIGSPNLASESPFLLLIASILEASITLALLETSLHIGDMGKYIRCVITPKIQKIIQEDDNFEFDVFKWEEMNTQFTTRTVMLGVTKIGKYSISIIASVTFLLLFSYLKSDNFTTWIFSEKFLFIVAIVLILFPIVSTLSNLLFLFGISRNQFELKQK